MEPLDRRIAKALAEPATPEAVQAVQDAALEEYKRLEREADALDSAALSPALEVAQAQAKRAEAADRRFLADRLDAACSALKARVVELRDAEAADARATRQEAAREARDELAREIAERYPAIVRELTSLVHRISENNALCGAAGIPAAAEQMGRGIPESFYIPGLGTCSTISAAALPMPAAPYYAWESYGTSGSTGWRGLDA